LRGEGRGERGEGREERGERREERGKSKRIEEKLEARVCLTLDWVH